MYTLKIKNEYNVSCEPKWERDPVISNMESVAELLRYLVVEEAPMNIISELYDLAVELDVKIEEIKTER